MRGLRSIPLALFLFIYCCCAAPCTYTATDGSNYDLSSLTVHAESSYYIGHFGSTNYTFNICDEITGVMIGTPNPPYCKDGAAVCQGEGGSYYTIGIISNMSFFETTAGPAGGVGVWYKGGQACRAPFIRNAKFHILCSPGFSGLVILNYSQPETCSYVFYLQSGAACPISSSDSGPTATTAGNPTLASSTTGDGITSTTATSSTSSSATSSSSASTGTTSTASSASSTSSTSTSSTSSTSPATSSSSSTAEPTHRPTTTTGRSSSDEIHRTKIGKAMIGLIVGLSVFVIIACALLIREFYRRRRAQEDYQLERLRLTGSTYSDVKKRYLK